VQRIGRCSAVPHPSFPGAERASSIAMSVSARMVRCAGVGNPGLESAMTKRIVVGLFLAMPMPSSFATSEGSEDD
jgi:hypothetical protein